MYSRTGNQIGSTQDTWIILVEVHGQFEVDLSVFVCSVIGVANYSYALECKEWMPAVPTLPYIS